MPLDSENRFRRHQLDGAHRVINARNSERRLEYHPVLDALIVTTRRIDEIPVARNNVASPPNNDLGASQRCRSEVPEQLRSKGFLEVESRTILELRVDVPEGEIFITAG